MDFFCRRRELGVEGIVAASRAIVEGMASPDNEHLTEDIYLESWDDPHLRPPLGDLLGMVMALVGCPACGVYETHHDAKPFPCDAVEERAKMDAQHALDVERYAAGNPYRDWDGYVILRSEFAVTKPAWFRKKDDAQTAVAGSAYYFDHDRADWRWFLVVAPAQPSLFKDYL